MLYGFAASGKTTLAKRYIDDHPLTIAIEGDEIITMIGQWRNNEVAARNLVLEHTKSITKNHLRAGHDVIVPYLLSDSTHSDYFAMIAKEQNVSFHEIYIKVEKTEAVNRLIKRGRFGEEGSRKLSEDDRPMLIERYEHMEKAMSHRPDVVTISSEYGNIDGAYQHLLQAIDLA